jgi:hypothetical protein
MRVSRAVLPPPIPSQLWSSKYHDVATSYPVRQVPASLGTETRRSCGTRHCLQAVAWLPEHDEKRKFPSPKAGCCLTRHPRIDGPHAYSADGSNAAARPKVPSVLLRHRCPHSRSGTSFSICLRHKPTLFTKRIAVCLYLFLHCPVTLPASYHGHRC